MPLCIVLRQVKFLETKVVHLLNSVQPVLTCKISENLWSVHYQLVCLQLLFGPHCMRIYLFTRPFSVAIHHLEVCFLKVLDFALNLGRVYFIILNFKITDARRKHFPADSSYVQVKGNPTLVGVRYGGGIGLCVHICSPGRHLDHFSCY